MSMSDFTTPAPLNRRSFLKLGAAGLTLSPTFFGASLPGQKENKEEKGPGKGPKGTTGSTRFLLACMTLPYHDFPLERALTGIKAAGFDYVTWGTTHKESGGKEVPVVAPDADPQAAKELGKRCRDLGLQPVMMFSGIYPEAANALPVLKSRILQAAAAGIPEVLTFGHTKGGNRKLWVERFKELGPIARDQGVRIVVKQHGGETGTGAACAEIIREVNDEGIKVNYDAGNVMDYLRVDPLADIQKCAEEIRSFCLKDHRVFPKDQDCAPGFGEIDHYRLLAPVAFTGRDMALSFENIFLPAIPRPTKPEGVDLLARRAREFMEIVIQGVQSRDV
jgi:sugar phosphate isomerase/epimerase